MKEINFSADRSFKIYTKLKDSYLLLLQQKDSKEISTFILCISMQKKLSKNQARVARNALQGQINLLVSR